MALLSSSVRCVFRFKGIQFIIPNYTHLRWKKIPRRKPTWLPMAPSKMFRIPQHPYVPPDEKQLMDDLLEEYYRKINSLRKLFQEELKEKSLDGGTSLEREQKGEEEFRLLLEENKKENERIRLIREETLEKLFQEKAFHLLQLQEKKEKEQQELKFKIEEIVRNEKAKSTTYITKENLDDAIENAIDNPVNINFAITVDGDIKWEGTPPPKFEIEMKKRISRSMETSI